MNTDRKQQLRILALRFGGCGCKNGCQIEQYADESMQDKPNGRFSVCELEADEHGIPLPGKGEDDEYEDD